MGFRTPELLLLTQKLTHWSPGHRQAFSSSAERNVS